MYISITHVRKKRKKYYYFFPTGSIHAVGYVNSVRGSPIQPPLDAVYK